MRLSSILIILILIIVVALFLGWSRIPDMIANNLSKKFNVSVVIDAINLGPKKIVVKKMQIGNPPSYTSLPKAFSAQEARIEAPLTRYFSKDVVIEEVNINDIYLGLEFDSASSTDGNWTVIMSNYRSSTAEENQEKKERSVRIKRLVLNNISIDLVFKKDGGSIKKLPMIDQIVLTDITSEGGIPMDQLMSSVLGQMLKSVFTKENLQNMLKNLLETPEKTLNKVIKPFKGLFKGCRVEENNPNNHAA